ncbi:bile acid:Na+ symporter, BASS family [Tistlia consotensis]|uniref:Bile acid:Na+ symporter, BASS family n=1 Tax=Tistlia consotensis USBA 355 TaxID=560819 RepID=A0A1Y6B7Y2_9PROT|nr:hypothetical protein [Tistlia consotensis]SME97705.1 bile acid:Na+ symporter, BASS family [Tistlia consotensis USBA 355]SNR57085.1 bile acid:Na+ symporter, BASS family [Tistlia consotensis]
MPLLAFLGRHGTRALFAGVFLGIALPGLAALFRPLLGPAVALLLLLALLRVDWQAMGAVVRRPWLCAALVAWILLGSPLVMWGCLQLLALPQPLTVALVLMSAAPPIVGGAAIAMLIGLDGALAVVIALFSTLLAPLSVPPLALLLLGLDLQIGLFAFMGRLAAIVALAFAGAWLLRRLVGLPRLRSLSGHIDGLVVLIMLVFAVAIMDGVTRTLLERPGTVALWLAAAFVANPGLQLIAALLFRPLGLRRALTVGLLAGNCNMGLLLAALPPGADFDVVLYFALAQLPMYMLPALALPLYRRLLEARGASTGG